MAIECGECEHDLRGGHAPDCSRHPDNVKRERDACPRTPMGEACTLCGMEYGARRYCPNRPLPRARGEEV